MIIYVNIANFTNWFINQVVSIWTQVINILSEIGVLPTGGENDKRVVDVEYEEV